MAGIPNDALLDFKRFHLRRYRNTGDGDNEPRVLQVLGFYRQLLDSSFKALTGLDAGQHTECYDILITDGNRKLKCVLNPECNHYIQKGQVTIGSLIEITLADADLHYNDTDLTAPSIVIIKNFTVNPADSLLIREDAIAHSTEAGEKESSCVPLASRRSSYLSPWCSEDPEGPVWNESAPVNNVRIDLAKTMTLHQLSKNWRTMTRCNKPLLVRILHKARLRHYGKPNHNQALPFQAYFEIADRSGVASAVLWNSMCTEFYSSLTEGDVLYITNYSVRGRYQIMSKPTMRQTDLNRFDLEINLNKQGQISGVKLVASDNILSTWQLPVLKYLFINRKQLGSMPNEFNCDVVGVVTWVGRYERHRKPNQANELWLSRWIELHDGTSHLPFRILVFATSQPEIHRQLHPACICVLTQLRVRHNLDQLTTSRQHRAVHLTTTNESQLYIHEDEVEGQYETHQAVKQLLQWCSSANYKEVLSWRRFGGYYTYPLLPVTLSGYKALFTDPSEFKVTPVEGVPQAAIDLRLRELVRIAIQGYIIKVRFIPTPGQMDGDDSPEAEQQQRYEVNVQDQEQWRLLGSAVVTGTTDPSPSCLPREYLPGSRHEILHGLNFAKIPNGKAWSQDKLSDCDVVGTAGYFIITISGLNGKHIVHAISVAPPNCQDYDCFLDMLNKGQLNSVRDQSKPLTNDVLDRVLKSAKNCHNERLLLVLDLYNPGGQKVEVVLNRAYPVGQT